MFSVAGPVPIFSERTSWDFRPAVSSPLSSSPARAESPLSPIDDNTVRQTQSSPIPQPKFKYASRPARPNPVVRKREEAQESRRKLFLQNVRQRADDRSYQRRDMEGTLLKSDWDRDMRYRYYAKQLEGDAMFSEADIDDAAAIAQERVQKTPDDVDMMVDAIAQEEQDELDALLLSYDQSSEPPHPAYSSQTTQSDPFSLSDDEDYDALFMNLVSQEGSEPDASSQQMDMS
ncbi:hypothetical protein ColTof4_00367 [Colletotrichum tofieldiae]|uniref:Uncharacterized protein n=1 Tax=Colletotrichum tofieldiae TaxID=708197 RepID=A0A166VH40_9PEZI|nr:hypothetical protein CT0861_00099 [Colletotrichum tofieldiae]GKT60234.1 hypothetical protein ColTof3_07573 [Colletotrichum tofieldiae]GKT67944.1 hypothetical protein ColTof4_00367 [Colletotrichum tofieldiae]GKT91085.1 hypothetical protein Ct61P_08935 [Colletotrichum tofieldiae]